MRPTFMPILLAAAFTLPAMAQDLDGMTFAPTIGVSLTEKIWVRTNDDSGLPGSMQLFLSDGVLLSTSCWEGYRLSNWQMLSDTRISWEEDGMAIDAEIVELNEAELVLALDLVSETVVQSFEAAPVPFVCPDMPR